MEGIAETHAIRSGAAIEEEQSQNEETEVPGSSEAKRSEAILLFATLVPNERFSSRRRKKQAFFVSSRSADSHWPDIRDRTACSVGDTSDEAGRLAHRREHRLKARRLGVNGYLPNAFAIASAIPPPSAMPRSSTSVAACFTSAGAWAIANERPAVVSMGTSLIQSPTHTHSSTEMP